MLLYFSFTELHNEFNNILFLKYIENNTLEN
jgi:hypothetical protein